LEQRHKLRRRRVRIAGIIAAVAAIAIVLVVVFVVLPSPSRSGPQATLSTTKGPWAIPSNAAPYIAAAGLQALGQEQTNFHYHAHLEVFVNGTRVTVPQYVGFEIANGNAIGLSSLHTHDTSGIIHIESSTNVPFILGQFFTQWGVRLGRGELGGWVDGGGKSLRTYVGGHLFNGDPSTIVLRRHEEIVLWYGPRSQTPSVPSSYQFPAGV
jgi:hypothetical protein